MNEIAKLSSEQVTQVAKLARIAISDQELTKYTEQLSAILNYVDQLSAIDTTKINSVGQITGLTNVMHSDQAGADLIDSKLFVLSAPQSENSFLKVRAVME